MMTSKKWSFSRTNYGLWYMRDSRNISGMVGIFFFLLMMIVFFSTIEKDHGMHKPNNIMENSPISPRSMNLFLSTCSFDGASSKISIVCVHVNHSGMEGVQQQINDMFAKVDTNSDLALSFVEIQDPLSVITPGWMRKINTSIHSMTIQNTALIEINAKSFENVPFQNLQELRLESTEDLRLTKEGFSGLKDLSSLIIQGPSCNIVSAEVDSLHELPSLSILQITECSMSPEVLKNLTGGNTYFKMNSLKILDIENNALGKVLSDSFTKLPILESLYLGNTNLHGGLESDAFRGTSPKQIIMKETGLTKLPEGIFDSIIWTNDTHLDLSDNMWNCTCEFLWFQQLYNRYYKDRIFIGDLLDCYHDNSVSFLGNFSFCGSTIQPTASTTWPTEGSTGHNPRSTPQPTIHSTSNGVSSTHHPVTTSMIPITKNPDHYDPIQCLPANRSSTVFHSDGKNTARVIYLGQENFRFFFTQIENEPKYEVSIDRSLSNELTLIFIHRAGWIFCLSELQNNFVVENLDYGQSYIVCLLRSSQSMLSTRNCQSLSVPNEWGKQTWITNDQKVPIVIGVSLGLICVLLVSLCGMYTYIKRNPFVVYGKENVIVVERKNSKKVTVQNQNFEQPRYPASSISWSDGYITPKLYESIGDFSIPYIDQYPSDNPGRSILPTLRGGHMGNEEFESIYPQAGEIYESVNTCPSPYYMNDDFSHNTYSSL